MVANARGRGGSGTTTSPVAKPALGDGVEPCRLPPHWLGTPRRLAFQWSPVYSASSPAAGRALTGAPGLVPQAGPSPKPQPVGNLPENYQQAAGSPNPDRRLSASTERIAGRRRGLHRGQPPGRGQGRQHNRYRHSRQGGQRVDERRSLVLTRARYDREAGENGVIINLANVVSVRVSEIDSAAPGHYL
jgi:hypothetical protein